MDNETLDKLAIRLLRCERNHKDALSFDNKFYSRESPDYPLPVWTCYGSTVERQDYLEETYIIYDNKVILYGSPQRMDDEEFIIWERDLIKFLNKLKNELDKKKSFEDSDSFNSLAEAFQKAKKNKHRKNRKKKHEKR